MNIRCNNCGSYKHTISECRNPITSYGVILFKKEENVNKILMINRKDSLCYIDFLRGKYNLHNIDHILLLLSRFSESELENVSKYSFDKCRVVRIGLR